MDRKYGIFTMGLDQIEDEEMQEPIMAVMGTVIVLDSGYNFVQRRFEYKAWSPHFEELEDEDEVPTYEPSMDEQGNVTWEKIDG